MRIVPSRIALTLAVASTALVPAVAAAQADNRDLARSIASGCANCHGTNGVSQGIVPALAGQPKADLVRKMQDFKSGRAAGTIMPQLAKGYTDEQIDLAAGFFAAQK